MKKSTKTAALGIASISGAFVLIALFFLLAFAVGFGLVIVPLWFLWNWLMPSLFGLPAVTLLQTFGLYLLFALIFGIIKGFCK